MKKLSAFLVASLLTLCVACSRPSSSTATSGNGTASPPEPSQKISSASVVKATMSPVTISPGASAQATLQLNIDSGYHINANPPSFPYLKATEVDIPPANGLSVGFITYPNALTRKFAFADKPLSVYEGSIAIKINLKADKSVARGTQNLSGKLRIQACDEQVCYAPGMLDLTIPVTIK